MELEVENYKTPKEWCEIFAAKGLRVSERNLRSLARKKRLCHLLGREMLISPEQMDAIWKQNVQIGEEENNGK